MRIVFTAPALILLALAAIVPHESQGPARAAAGTAAQGQARRSSTASPRAGGGKIPCKTPENASACYWTHGRLSVYNGNPSFRIWKIGTRRLLGVFNGPSHFPPRTIADDENPELPLNVERAYEADNRRLQRATGLKWAVPPPVFADFEVCALEPERKGEMQAVCIESAKNIFIERED